MNAITFGELELLSRLSPLEMIVNRIKYICFFLTMILLMKKLIKKATHKFGSFLCLDFFKPHTQGETDYVDVNVRIRPVWCAILICIRTIIEGFFNEWYIFICYFRSFVRIV